MLVAYLIQINRIGGSDLPFYSDMDESPHTKHTGGKTGIKINRGDLVVQTKCPVEDEGEI